jgi:hypothetical protein
MKFKVKDSNIFPMPGNNHLLHLGTITMGVREFVVMAAVSGSQKGKCYIEEVVLSTIDFSSDVFASCKFINDDNLAFDLAMFANEKGLTNIKKRYNELGDRGKLEWITGSPGLKNYSLK